MRQVTDFPNTITEIQNTWIPLCDGTRLAARIWMPEDAESLPVPAVLEYLPYRKDDATEAADAARHPYFAGHGYASVRVDLRGTGSSDGLLLGEYLAQEHEDALEVLRWLAAQPWCTGDVGMIGYSWGGFNGLQVAALRPPELKAVITHASTDDRYLDDCHYMGGCMLGSDMLKWATSMLTYTLQPPDPRFVGDQWRDIWLHRLRHAPELARDWITHQRNDEFWRHGSVAEDYSAIECPVFVVGGWADAYTNAVPRLLEHLSVPRIGLIGPWGHMMPYEGVPGPAIGFLQECVRWWDRWLKGVDNGIEDGPACRVWLQEYVPPAAFHAERPGRWLALDAWPPEPAGSLLLPLGSEALPASEGVDVTEVVMFRGHQQCGQTAGVWCANGNADEIATDQRPDDALSLTFTTPPLEDAVEVLGSPLVALSVSSDMSLALVSARVEDVAPGGESLLVSWGLLNLAHRDGHDAPRLLDTGQVIGVEVALRVCGHRFAPGHRIRLALSPTYWPHAWPSPETVTLGIHTSESTLELPLYRGGQSREPAAPSGLPEVAADPRADGQDTDGRTRKTRFDPRTCRHDIIDSELHVRTVRATGAPYREQAQDTYSIVEDDPLSAEVRCQRETSSECAGSRWAVTVESEMTCDADSFTVIERWVGIENDTELYSSTRTRRILRDHL